MERSQNLELGAWLRVESGVWRVECEEWRVECEEWRVEGGESEVLWILPACRQTGRPSASRMTVDKKCQN